MTWPAAHHAQQVLAHLKALKDATAHPVPAVQGLAIGNHSDREPVTLAGSDYYEIVNTLAQGMAELAPILRQLMFSYLAAAQNDGLVNTAPGQPRDVRRAAHGLNSTNTAVQNTYKALHGVAADLLHVKDSPTRHPKAEPVSERAMAVAYVRGNLFPPLPEPYADWLIELRNLTREGVEGSAVLEVPPYIQDTGCLPRGASRDEEGKMTISLYEILAALRQTDLLPDETS